MEVYVLYDYETMSIISVHSSLEAAQNELPEEERGFCLISRHEVDNVLTDNKAYGWGRESMNTPMKWAELETY